MHAGDCSDDGQTQAVVLMCTAACAVATEEAIKQPWQVRRFDGRPVIGYRHRTSPPVRASISMRIVEPRAA